MGSTVGSNVGSAVGNEVGVSVGSTIGSSVGSGPQNNFSNYQGMVPILVGKTYGLFRQPRRRIGNPGPQTGRKRSIISHELPSDD